MSIEKDKVPTQNNAGAKGKKRIKTLELASEIIDRAKPYDSPTVENADFICADAGEAAEKLAAEGIRPDVVVIDPPRKGCDASLLHFLAKREVPRIVYVSCGPDSLARDCALLRTLGYEIGTVTPVDLFPRTGHVESVVCLTRE